MILVLHQGAIGDFLLTLSVVAAARDHLGDPAVEVIASAASARWAAGRSIIQRWISPETVGLHTLFAAAGPLDPRLTAHLQEAALVLNFLGGPDEPPHHHLASATSARVIGVDPRPTAETLAAHRHITDQWAADIRAQGLTIGHPVPPRITVQQTPPPAHTPPQVILHPGSGGRHKCWPLEHFLSLADALTAAGASVAWMLGPAETEPGDQRAAAIHARTADRRETLIIEPDLEAAAQHIASSNLYLGNDGGMTHVAAAVGITTLVVFVATDPRVWRPLGDNVLIVEPRSHPDAGFQQVLNLLHAHLKQ